MLEQPIPSVPQPLSSCRSGVAGLMCRLFVKTWFDPASVAYDTLNSAVANDIDVVLVDTAGRLHNKVDLMNELTKIRNVANKVVEGLPMMCCLSDGSTDRMPLNRQSSLHLQSYPIGCYQTDGRKRVL